MVLHAPFHTIGIIASGAPGPIDCFKAGMRDHGFIEGETVRYEERIAHGDAARFPGFAREMVKASVDLIAAVGAIAARAAQSTAADIPIVYGVVVEPVEDGFATATGKALDNMTGITTFDDDQAGTNVALLRAVKGDIARVAILADSNVSTCLVQANARALEDVGLSFDVFPVSGLNPDLASTFARMRGCDSLVVLEHPVNGANAQRIAELALAHHLPTVVARTQADEGGLFGYGTNLRAAAYQMADYARRILSGALPGELPINSFHRAELVVNMRTARKLGLTVPISLLDRAIAVID
jgi:putative ABC transport system substrate-binding protein